MFQTHYTAAQVADILGVSKATLNKWAANGSLNIDLDDPRQRYHYSQLTIFDEFKALQDSNWDNELKIKPEKPYSIVELFAGAGGLALGMEKAGFKSVLLNEFDKHACATLQLNRPDWHVIQGDVRGVDFTDLRDTVDVLSGGFPCQTFSFSGKRMGFEDTRGTLFFEFARAVKEINPKVFVAENVRGLLNHDKGKTLEAIKSVIDDLGYKLVPPRVLRAIFYQVPQKRERLFLVAIRKDLDDLVDFQWPCPFSRIMSVKDALKKGDLYNTDVPDSVGQSYAKRKAEILAMVPEGGYWRDLPVEIQKEYMLKSYYLEGGKTGIARRLSWDDPSLTLTCAPAQKQTERCHPEETRPLTVREYARIQTFPDDWQFAGSITAQYKQIGNAVPVNLAYAVGRQLISLMNSISAAERVSKESSEQLQKLSA